MIAISAPQSERVHLMNLSWSLSVHSCVDSFTYACISMHDRDDAGPAARTDDNNKKKKGLSLCVTQGRL